MNMETFPSNIILFYVLFILHGRKIYVIVGISLLCGGHSTATYICYCMVESCGFANGGRRITESFDILQGLF